MKKLLILFLLVSTLIGCSTESENQTEKFIHPPAWLIGDWSYVGSEFLPKYRFTNEDLIKKVSVVLTISTKQKIDEAISQGLSVDIQEDISESSYKLVLNIAGEVEVYQFIKVDNTHFTTSGWLYVKL